MSQMNVMMTMNLNQEMKKAEVKGMEAPEIEKLFWRGLENLDVARYNQEDQTLTGKRLSGRGIIIGEEIEEELTSLSTQTKLSKGEIFRMAIAKGLENTYRTQKGLHFDEENLIQKKG